MVSTRASVASMAERFRHPNKTIARKEQKTILGVLGLSFVASFLFSIEKAGSNKDEFMFFHRKELIQPVNVGVPDARFGTYLLEQFGGATGELTAALQYWVQSFHVENAGIRDMLQDIAIEEFSHLEMVGKLIAQHTSELDQTSVHDAPLFKLKGGGPHFLDSQGSCWTAAYIQEGGNVVRDLRANISAEAGARQTYEALIKACDDEGTKKTLHHLLNSRNHPRENVHEGARRDGQVG